jgi:ABC-type branched-subunit amino acid transport system ATPase component
MTMPQQRLSAATDAAPPVAADENDIVIAGVRKAFGGNVAISDCTVTIPANCVSCIIGPNGAGKSTVFNIITGFVRPDRGSITFRGRNLVGLAPSQIFALGIARSFQGMKTFARLSALDNLLLAATASQSRDSLLHPLRARRRFPAALDSAWATLKSLGLAAVGNRPAGSLGYAEQKLLSIGRMMMTDASVLLLDEPLAGLDAHAVEAFIARIRRLCHEEGRHICIVEHNLNAVRNVADRIVFMAEGTVKAIGSTAEILGREDLARLYLGVAAS